MPSSRAILCDIHELGLDPKQPHRKIKASGRLAHTAKDTELKQSIVQYNTEQSVDFNTELLTQLRDSVAVSASPNLTAFNTPEVQTTEVTPVSEPVTITQSVQETTPDYAPVVSKGRRNKNTNQ
jgi:hypothetical protein